MHCVPNGKLNQARKWECVQKWLRNNFCRSLTSRQSWLIAFPHYSCRLGYWNSWRPRSCSQFTNTSNKLPTHTPEETTVDFGMKATETDGRYACSSTCSCTMRSPTWICWGSNFAFARDICLHTILLFFLPFIFINVSSSQLILSPPRPHPRQQLLQNTFDSQTSITASKDQDTCIITEIVHALAPRMKAYHCPTKGILTQHIHIL